MNNILLIGMADVTYSKMVLSGNCLCGILTGNGISFNQTLINHDSKYTNVGKSMKRE